MKKSKWITLASALVLFSCATPVFADDTDQPVSTVADTERSTGLGGLIEPLFVGGFYSENNAREWASQNGLLDTEYTVNYDDATHYLTFTIADQLKLEPLLQKAIAEQRLNNYFVSYGADRFYVGRPSSVTKNTTVELHNWGSAHHDITYSITTIERLGLPAFTATPKSVATRQTDGDINKEGKTIPVKGGSYQAIPLKSHNFKTYEAYHNFLDYVRTTYPNRFYTLGVVKTPVYEAEDIKSYLLSLGVPEHRLSYTPSQTEELNYVIEGNIPYDNSFSKEEAIALAEKIYKEANIAAA